MRIRSTPWLAFGLFLIFTIVAAIAALDRVTHLGRTVEQGREAPFALAASLLEAHDAAYALHSLLQDATLSGRPQAVAALRPAMDEAEKRLHAALTLALAPHLDEPEVVAPLARDLGRWAETRNRVAELMREGRWSDAHALFAVEGELALEAVHLSLNRVLEAERQRAARLGQQTREAERKAWGAALALAVATGGALAAVALGGMLFARTHRPLMRLRSALLALAEGNAAVDIPYLDHPGTIGAMARAIAAFRRSQVERDNAVQALRLSEERLRGAVNEARRADETKSRFLAAASHDLRQPLQAMRLFLDALDRRLRDKSDRLVLTGALNALAAGEDLLRDYLDVSVLEAGIVEPVIDAVAIGPLLAGLAEECRPAATDKGLTLRLAPCTALVRSDARLLHRMLRNLVANAVRYTIEGGVLIGCRRRADTLRIEIWDTGIGIPEDKLAAVFEDFYQLDNPERDRTKGLGLGLSVVDRTARLLGHGIEMRSVLGRGSMFAVIVPLAEASSLAAREAA